MPDWRQIGHEADIDATKSIFFRLGVFVGMLISFSLVLITVLVTQQNITFGWY